MRGVPNTHTLYRMFDDEGFLLYVGLTNNPAGRFRDHNAADWWDQVASITVEHHCDREDLKAAEAEAIKTENPVYNKTGNRTPGVQPVPTGPVGKYVLVEYNGPEQELTPEEREQSRAAAERIGQMLSGARAVPA